MSLTNRRYGYAMLNMVDLIPAGPLSQNYTIRTFLPSTCMQWADLSKSLEVRNKGVKRRRKVHRLNLTDLHSRGSKELSQQCCPFNFNDEVLGKGTWPPLLIDSHSIFKASVAMPENTPATVFSVNDWHSSNYITL